ncbi:ParB-like protein [Aneurinibacillus aneurinilyticus ATCC 12856]|uniref:ParB-like protein n=2 Tax=Aneurinibacillus aneurinilyticus TaxID=1391 RepID=U1X6T3_ANEAE|nr:ParB-like protein [Aneurinibacillus aneurinilyticus ATCC 12856]
MYRICNEDKAAPVSGFLFWRMTTMDIRKIPVEKINPAPYNPRIDLQPGDEEYERLKRSIREFGYVEPLVWNERTGNLVGGHQRYKILMEEQPTELLVSVVNMDDTKEKALNIALNKIEGGWDEERLAALLESLQTDIDIELTGFNQEEAEKIIADFQFNEGDADKDFNSTEIDLDDFSEENFECVCPKCGFMFNPKKGDQ